MKRVFISFAKEDIIRKINLSSAGHHSQQHESWDEVLRLSNIEAVKASLPKGKKAAANKGTSISEQKILLAEDRAKVRSALADIPLYDSSKDAVAHQLEVVRSYCIATGNGGSIRASEPLFSDEFLEMCEARMSKKRN